MKILVINSGSSSLKFTFFEVLNGGEKNADFKVLIKGIVDGIGLNDCFFEVEFEEEKMREDRLIADHKIALKLVLEQLVEKNTVVTLDEIKVVGHRVVHGGDFYDKAVLVDHQVVKNIESLCELAPLHNPPNLEGIKACEELFEAKNIAVFDTAFHQSLPERAYLYGLPYSMTQDLKIRRYGFHGINHRYVTELVLAENGGTRVISCHLGNGASVAASIDGKCVDTSMGFTPLEGLMMGTRCGDIDPAIVFYLMEKKSLSVDEIDDLLNRESGLKGVSEMSADMRVLFAESKQNNPAAIRAMDLFCYRVQKYIGAYAAVMDGVDAIVFTAGLGQNAWYLRQQICENLGFLGVELNADKNQKNDYLISRSDVDVYVIDANEELQIAKEVVELI